ncbi:hypothetical protein D5S17_18015 [Pseudonocardiaceae bacterium YIM PH 21723]|nr:hypothetical protein D5S17_18015 [Pseudonocardiaceae bacterium YIM PH 21723]
MGDRAVVIGAGIGGLLAAAALAKEFTEVVVLERDPAIADDVPGPAPAVRTGVPQGRHLHLLLMRGAQAMQSLLPGLETRLKQAGALTQDLGVGMVLAQGSRTSPPRPSGLFGHSVSRPVLEECLRTEVGELAAVDIRYGVRVTGPSIANGRIDGVLTDGGPISASLVVDASGRNSRSHEWVQELGGPTAREDAIDGHIEYLTAWLPDSGPLTAERPALITMGEKPFAERRAFALRVEQGRVVLGVTGRGDDQPPTDHDGLRGYLASIGNPLMMEIAEGLTADVPLYRYAKLINRRHRYPSHAGWPPGLLIMGDALCHFNPVYGQGMTVAALQAEKLAAHAARLRRDGGATPTVQRALAAVTKAPWRTATSQDLVFAGNPPAHIRALSRLLDTSMTAAIDDPHVHRALMETIQMVSGTAMLRPRVLIALLTAR